MVRDPQFLKRLILSLLLLFLVCICALCFGATQAEWSLIWDLRFPRVLLACGIGMGLAVTGAVLQVLFNNPLCEPYVLGISSGSALGVVLGLSLGVSWNWGGIVGTSFLGALGFAAILASVSKRGSLSQNGHGKSGLLLVGVSLGFLGNALLALWMTLTEPTLFQNGMAWFFGDLSRARLDGALISLLMINGISIHLWSQSRLLDAYLLGEEVAHSIGVDGQRLERKLLVLTSLLVGICVSSGGVIGFVGLLVPHGLRRWVGPAHGGLIPLCAVWGAGVLVFSDLISRWIVRPYELPVGVVTALLGSPFLIWTLLRNFRMRSSLR